MSKASFVRHFPGRMELQEARTDLPPRLEVPGPEYTDGMHGDVFQDALDRLGFGDLERVHEDGRTKLVAPEGHMFRVTGAFTIWPDGNDIQWGYGPPADSYEQWRLRHREQLARLEAEGRRPEAAEEEVEAWNDIDDGVPDIHHFSGKTLTMSFDRVEWGSLTAADRQNERSSDDEPPTVTITVQGFTETWYEQAQRFIKLPSGGGDRLQTIYEYGEPGVIPCWRGEYSEGDIERMRVELVPIEEGEGDTQLPVMRRLWVPESVRWSVYDDYPDLVDQHGDHANRSGFGGAMRALGAIAYAFGGQEGNAFDRIAERGSLLVVDDPMVAHMDLDKLAEQLEQLIDEANSRERPPDEREEERKKRAEEDLADKSKQLVVITDVHESIHEVVRQYGESDEWLECHVEHWNRAF